MSPSAENTFRRKDTVQETEPLVHNEERVRQFRLSDLENRTTGHAGHDESRRRVHFYDASGDSVSDKTNGKRATAKEKSGSNQLMSREDVIQSMERLQKAAEKVARTACRGRRPSACKQREAEHSTLEFTSVLDQTPASKHGRTQSASLFETRGGEHWPQTARSLSNPLTTARQDDYRNLRARNGTEPGLPAAEKAQTIQKYLLSRARGSQSDNSFLLKRCRDRRTFLYKKRAKSEPSSRSFHSSRFGYISGGSKRQVVLQKENLPAPQKTLSYANGNIRAQLIQPQSRKASAGQDGSLPDKKRMAQSSHFLEPRSSPRLLQRRKAANNLPTAAELLHNNESKKRKRSNDPGYLGSTLPQRLRSSTRHAIGTEEKDPGNKRQSKSRSKSRKATDENTVANLTNNERMVNIPVDVNMATDLRRYSEWPDDSGALVTARGCLLPARYNFSGIPGVDWICPVRSCRRCFPTQARLGPHFVAAHHSCLLNDNRDGTFTIVGKSKNEQGGKYRPALVKSKKPLNKNTPPMLEPQPPATWTTAAHKELWAANLKNTKSIAALDSGEVITVDEMMLQTGFFTLSSAGSSGASESSDLSRTPSFQNVHGSYKPQASFASGSNPTGDAISEEESATNSQAHENGRREKAPNAPRDATKENWRLIRRFITGRQFYLPKRGHFAALLSTPRSRDIILRPGARFVADQPKSVRILIAHMTGEESPAPCSSCNQGRGPFKKCVAISKAAAGETTNGIVCCTNCATKRGLPHRCNMEVLLTQPAAGRKRKPRKERLVREPSPQSGLGEIGSQVTKVDSRFTLAVHTIPVDGSIELDAAHVSLRLCAVAVGKIMVDLESNAPFLLGTHGMFKLMPETSAQVSNASEAEAVLHVSTLKS